jgi:hypothetical protein
MRLLPELPDKSELEKAKNEGNGLLHPGGKDALPSG